MFKKCFFSIFAILLVMGFSSAASSWELFPSPTIVGSTGLVRVPTADVIPYKNFNLGLEFGTNLEEGKSSLFYKMNMGTFHGLELGIVGGTNQSDDAIREGVFVNMKYSLSTDSGPHPLLLAIGIENLSSKTQTDVYMLATKYFEGGPKFTFGFMGDFPGDKFRPLGLVGLGFPVFQNIVVMGDILAGEVLFQFNAGMRYYFTPIFALSVNALNVFENETNPQGKDQKAILVGFSWANPF
ncbi:MAG: hypothetical protein NT030_02085 [Candidatus Saganbacteria bacterium]|nr:hypothetical protein [Candidatus Saganbacteria bacterium]